MFWNIQRKASLENVICDLINAENIDILILAEGMNIKDSLIQANSGLTIKKSKFKQDHIQLTPKLYSNNNGFTVDHYHTFPNTRRMVFHFLEIPNRLPILLCSLHLRSKLMRNIETQCAEALNCSSYISDIEDDNLRTIVVGDFNINPFESGMISPIGFNATLAQNIALNGPRLFMNKSYEYFYNPLWSSMGDIIYNNGGVKLPGSYFFQNNDDVTQVYWNVFDNILIRPNLINEVDLSAISFIEQAGGHNLIVRAGNDYTINSSNYSDHLPLKFTII